MDTAHQSIEDTMNEETKQDMQPIPVLGITTNGDLLMPPGLKQFEVLALLQALNAKVKKVLDNLTVQ